MHAIKQRRVRGSEKRQSPLCSGQMGLVIGVCAVAILAVGAVLVSAPTSGTPSSSRTPAPAAKPSSISNRPASDWPLLKESEKIELVTSYIGTP